MQVPFVDLKAQYQSIKNEVEENIQEVLDTGSYIQGPLLRDFEQAFARFCGVSGCVGVASGCDALLWALEACGIGEGDEVITQVNTYAATVLAIMRAGAEPVLVDCREDDYQMDVSAVRAVITKKTRAIMPVHLYGHPADMDAVLALADEYDLAVIEDAAQAHGAMYKNKPCGSMGMAGCFSFYPGKNLGAYGDGGAVVSNDGQIIDHVRMVINYGQSRKYHHDLVGWNARLDTLQAGILLAKLQHLNEWNERRRNNAVYYRKILNGLPVVLPTERNDCRHIYHLFVIQCDHRDELLSFLADKGISCGIHYPIPIHFQKAFACLDYAKGTFPIAEQQAGRILSLPMCAELSHEQMDYIADSFSAFFN